MVGVGAGVCVCREGKRAESTIRGGKRRRNAGDDPGRERGDRNELGDDPGRERGDRNKPGNGERWRQEWGPWKLGAGKARESDRGTGGNDRHSKYW